MDYERSHNHILSVVAYDCGMRQSLPVMVTIKVSVFDRVRSFIYSETNVVEYR